MPKLVLDISIYMQQTTSADNFFRYVFSIAGEVLISIIQFHTRPGRVAQSVTCLATDTCLTADPGVASLILARYHTFVEIDH